MTMNGYHFECACGERYNTVRAAVACRKCRAYCVFGYCTHVTDLRNGKVVHGEVPSNADHAAAVAEYEAYRAIEAKELEYDDDTCCGWRGDGGAGACGAPRRRSEKRALL